MKDITFIEMIHLKTKIEEYQNFIISINNEIQENNWIPNDLQKAQINVILEKGKELISKIEEFKKKNT
jgi:hypothetical protein